ncbi:MAG: type II secretion system protein GspL [Pseudomonadota bacterium]
MSATVVIFAGDSPEAPLTWRVLGARQMVEHAGQGMLDALSDERASEAILVLPGYSVSAIPAHLPARNERQALAAAPFAIEEEIAADPEDQHFALMPVGAAAPEGQRTILAIERALLSRWIDALGARGIALRSVLADFQCVPVSGETVHAVGLPDRLVLRQGDWGVAIDADIATAVVPAVLESRSTDESPLLLAGTGHGLAIFQSAYAETADPETVLAEGAVHAGAGLLQGDFAVRQRSSDAGASLPVLKWPAALTVAAAVLVSTVNVLQGALLQSRAETIRANTETMFLKAFPETDRVVNIRAQLRRVSQGGQTDQPDFLVLSGFLSSGLDAVDAVSVESVRFDSDTGELSASILFDSYDALSRFRTAIETAGGRVVEGGSRQVGDRRAGDVKVTRR